MSLLKKKSIILVGFFILISNLLFSQKNSFYQTGFATYYSDAFQGRRTTSGERYYNHQYTAAHATLPLNTLVKVTNLYNNKSVVVKINDRCAHRQRRVIDLSKAAAKQIDIFAYGRGKVSVEIVKPSDLMMIENVKDNMLQPLKDSSGSIGKYDIYGLIMHYQHHNLSAKNPFNIYQPLFLAGYANTFYHNSNTHIIKKMLCALFPGISFFRFIA